LEAVGTIMQGSAKSQAVQQSEIITAIAFGAGLPLVQGCSWPCL